MMYDFLILNILENTASIGKSNFSSDKINNFQLGSLKVKIISKPQMNKYTKRRENIYRKLKNMFLRLIFFIIILFIEYYDSFWIAFISASEQNENSFYIVITHKSVEHHNNKSIQNRILGSIIEHNWESLNSYYDHIDKSIENPFQRMCLVFYMQIRTIIDDVDVKKPLFYAKLISMESIRKFIATHNINLTELNHKKPKVVLKHFAMMYIYNLESLNIENIVSKAVEAEKINHQNFLLKEIFTVINRDKKTRKSKDLKHVFIDYDLRNIDKTKEKISLFIKSQEGKFDVNDFVFVQHHLCFDIFVYFLQLNFESCCYDLKDTMKKILDIKIPTTESQKIIYVDEKPIKISLESTQYIHNNLKNHIVTLYQIDIGCKAIDLISKNIVYIVESFWIRFIVVIQNHVLYLKLGKVNANYLELMLEIKMELENLNLPISTTEIDQEISKYRKYKSDLIANFYNKNELQEKYFTGSVLITDQKPNKNLGHALTESKKSKSAIIFYNDASLCYVNISFAFITYLF